MGRYNALDTYDKWRGTRVGKSVPTAGGEMDSGDATLYHKGQTVEQEEFHWWRPAVTPWEGPQFIKLQHLKFSIIFNCFHFNFNKLSFRSKIFIKFETIQNNELCNLSYFSISLLFHVI